MRDWARVVDCGDPRLSPLDKLVAFRTLDRAHELVSLRPAANPNRTAAPRVLMLGGDHSTTLSALRAVHKRWGKVSVVHFDSHIGERLSEPVFARDYCELTTHQIPGIPKAQSRNTRKDMPET